MADGGGGFQRDFTVPLSFPGYGVGGMESATVSRVDLCAFGVVCKHVKRHRECIFCFVSQVTHRAMVSMLLEWSLSSNCCL